MILEKGWADVGDKVVDSFQAANQRVKKAIQEGKEILILPGVYDLIHAGHVSWIYESIEHYINQLSQQKGYKVSKEDIFVVIPFDNDNLVFAQKKHKHEEYGGTEKLFRPIVKQDIRGLALANLECVDLVVPLPSPLEIDNLLSQPKDFTVAHAQELLHLVSKQWDIGKETINRLEKCIHTYSKIVTTDFQTIQKSFTAELGLEKFTKMNGSNYIRDNVQWNNLAWELSIYLHFGDKPIIQARSQMRVLSLRDSYNKESAYLMKVSGISISEILDDYIVSTTEIIQKVQDEKLNIIDIMKEAKLI